MEKPTSKKLIDASNLLCEFVANNLPEDWVIQLTMSSEGAEMALYDADGNEVDDVWDGDRSTLMEMCDYANEPKEPE